MAKVTVTSAIAILLIFYIFTLCSSKKIETNGYFDAYSNDPYVGSYISLINLREKRQTPTDLKNEYQSVSQNAKINTMHISSAAQTEDSVIPESSSTTHASIIVPYNSSDRPLLGVNGTGQRKDMPEELVKQNITSVPILVSANENQTRHEQIIDTVDVPEKDTIEAIKNKNLTVNYTTDHHNYYNSTMYVNKDEVAQIWNTIKNITPNSMLSQSHRRAMTVELSFDFPFYGHPVRNITVATGGFLYTGEYVHSWLAATQYIAPLMANFDTSLSNSSFVRLTDNGTAFTVIWENVSLQDKQDVGKFTFSATLHKSGDIVFTYFVVPIFVNVIQDDKHPVKVGLSDAYIIDKVVYFARRKTIYEYHRVNFARAEITNATIIYLKALTTCHNYTDCESCINHKTTFDCIWCPVLNRCSTGTDRRKQEWLQKGCDRAQIVDLKTCPRLGEKGNNVDHVIDDSTEVSSSTSENNTLNGNSSSNHKTDNLALHPTNSSETASASITPVNGNSLSRESKAAFEEQAHHPKGIGVVFGVLVPICLLASILVWILYAYRNPHTKSGQLLIQYRPSQWSWRRGEARYTAATIHM